MQPLTARERARLYIHIAERQRASGGDATLIAALVRAAWRAHAQADAACDNAPSWANAWQARTASKSRSRLH